MKHIYSLNKGWRFSREKSDFHVDDYFNSFSNDTKTGVSKGANGDGFYDGEWETVDLPHDWTAHELPAKENSSFQGYKPQGEVWYRKTFILDCQEKENRIFLKFGAIAIYSDIYVNNILVYENRCSYSPICVEITDFVNCGEKNLIAVRADSRVKEGWWYEGGGIYADAFIIVSDKACFVDDGVFAYGKKENDKWHLHIKTEIDGKVSAPKISVDVPELNINSRIYSIDEDIDIEICDPILWDCDNPYLYDVTVSLYDGDKKLDCYSIKTGFRTAEFDADKGFFLNGKYLKLQGICVHHDHAGVGVAMTYDIHRYRIERLKEMGVNIIRTAHNPQTEDFYRACDELGILVMDETRHFSSTKRNLHELAAMVRRDRNHPCVILWSMFNEEPIQGTNIGENIAFTMKKTILALDPTRKVTGAVNGPLESRGAVKVLDVMGFNYFQYGYDFFHKNVPDMPIIGSENASYMATRGEGLSNRETSHIADGTKKLGENFFAWSSTPGSTWREVEKRDYVLGAMYWNGFDYRGETVPFGWPAVTSSFGVMDMCGFPKHAYYWIKVLWSKKPAIYLIPVYNENNMAVKLFCYSNCERIELFINGENFLETKNDKYEGLSWDIAPISGTICARGYIGDESCVCEISTPSGKPKIEIESFGGKENVFIFNVYLKDENGNVFLDADNMVNLSVSGGKIIGLGNGDNACHEPEIGNTRSLFHGCMQVIVKKDDVKLSFKAEIDEIGSKTLDINTPVFEKYEYVKDASWELNVGEWWITDILDHYPSDEEIKKGTYSAWIPTTAGYGKNLQMSGKHGYAMMLTYANIPDNLPKNAKILCRDIKGNIDILVDCKPIYKTNGENNHNIALSLDGISGRVCISVIFKLDGQDCGIYEKLYIGE